MKVCKTTNCQEECMKGRAYCFNCIMELEKEKKLGYIAKSKNKPKIKKKKKPPTEQQITERLRKQCVAIAKQISKIKDNYKCQYCGVGKPQRMIHSHHFFHEGLYKSMSADPDNLITLCASHHQGGVYMRSNDGFNFHNSPRESTEWFIEHYPERYKELKERSLQYVSLNYKYWEEKKIKLKAELKILEQNAPQG